MSHLSPSRRQFLGAGAFVAAGSLPHLLADAKPTVPPGFAHYRDLLKTLEKRSHKVRVLGHTPDRQPVVAVKAGGEKTPAILISAGSHSTEHAGVAAAVDLISELKTSHQLYVLPCRDPMGLSGFRHVLGLGLGVEPEITTVADAEKLLRAKGEILYDRDGRLLVLIGEYGYANKGFYRSFKKGEAFLEAMKGRRLWWPSNYSDAPGSGPLQRAYTQVVTPEGEILHLNRFHDTVWAPVEVRCVRRLMAEIKPGLTLDLHEYGGNAFWMSTRKQRTKEDDVWEQRMAREAARAGGKAGGRYPEKKYSPGSFFELIEPGVYLLNPGTRGEGLNLVDFAARHYGPGITVETGMRQDFGLRMRLHKAVAQTAVKVFEERYAKG